MSGLIKTEYWFFLLLLSALWWRRPRDLCRLPDGRDWVLLWWARPSSINMIKSNYLLMGGVALPPWELFGLRWPSPGVFRFCGRVNGDLQEDLSQGGTFSNYCCQCPCSCGESLQTLTATGDPPNTSRWFWFSLLWGHCSFPLGLGVCKILFVPPMTRVSVYPSPVEVL